MSLPAADKRAALVERDDGDPADTVFVARGVATHYHDERECHHLRKSTRTIAERPRRSVMSRTRRAPCLSCVLDGD